MKLDLGRPAVARWANLRDSQRVNLWDSLCGILWVSLWDDLRNNLRDNLWDSLWDSLRENLRDSLLERR